MKLDQLNLEMYTNKKMKTPLTKPTMFQDNKNLFSFSKTMKLYILLGITGITGLNVCEQKLYK